MKYGEVDFNKIAENYDKWWRGELGRPIIPVMIWSADPGRAAPDVPDLGFRAAYDERYSPEEILDRADYSFACREYYGEAFPMVNMSAFGAGAMSVFTGATPTVADFTVWFDEPKHLPLKELHFEFDANNKYFKRVKEFYIIFAQKYADKAIISMADLGGVLDILSIFRGAENLLCDCIEEPDEVLRCVWEIQDLWLKYFNIFTEIIAPNAKGYSNWNGIYGAKPNYILQCDFSYMIGPEMFAKFVLPELEDTSSKLDRRTFYHLDGIGELPHLDQLLDSKLIHGIQWVFGDGTPGLTDWSDIYKKIGASGKKLHNLQANLDNLDWALNLLPKPDSLFIGAQGFWAQQKPEALEKLKRAGVEINQ